MAYISVTLSPNDPISSNYSITVSECGGSNEVLVASGLSNPNDFPYIFNSSDYLVNGDCFSYTITDTASGCQSVGTFDNGVSTTPTPTSTLTVTPTPAEDTISIGVDMHSGSTVIDFTITSSKEVTQDTLVSFSYVLYKLDGSQKTISVSATIKNGTNRVTVSKTLSDDFKTVDTSKYTIKNEVTDNSSFTINRYSTKTLEGQRTNNVVYDFVNCCNERDVISVLVDRKATESGGWVKPDGGAVRYNNKCYKPLKLSRETRYVSAFYGPDYRSCSDSACRCVAEPTPTPTPSVYVPVLSTNYTLRDLQDVDSNGIISLNINNKDKDKKAFFHKGKCYSLLSNDNYTQGVNNGKLPVVKSSETYTSVIGCKSSNQLPLGVSVEYSKFDGDFINPVYPKKYKPKTLFLGKGFSSTELTTTVNALTACGQISNPDIFVWYDNSGSYGMSLLKEASKGIRKWYTSLLLTQPQEDGNGNTQSIYSGRLFESTFWNKEAPLTLCNYPSLTSLSGGTINGETISNPWLSGGVHAGAQDSTNSDLIKLWTGNQYGDGGDSFVDVNGVVHQFSGNSHPALYELGGTSITQEVFDQNFKGYSALNKYANISQNCLNNINDGVPFYDSIIIIISNEFNGSNEGATTDNSASTLINPPALSSGVQNRWKTEYDNYLKVYKQKKNMGYGSLNYLFSMPQNSGVVNSYVTASYIYTMLSLYEGQPFSTESQQNLSTSYTNENGELVNITWPNLNEFLNNEGVKYDFSNLSTNSIFSFLNYSGGYFQNGLSAQEQLNGIGLKNFGFSVDPSLPTFDNQVLTGRLSSYINAALLDSLQFYTLVECDAPNSGESDNYTCFEAGQSVIIGDNEFCLQVVQNTLLGNQYENTGIFEVPVDGYSILTGITDQYALFDNCESCECEDDLSSNNRQSITLNNTTGSNLTVTVHGVYDEGNGEQSITEDVSVNANSSVTFNSYDFSTSACIKLSDTVNGIPVGITTSVGECCDPSNPLIPTPTPTQTPTQTETPTQTPTQTMTPTMTMTPSISHSPTPPPSQSQTPTMTPTQTPSITPTQTPSHTPTQTPSATPPVTPGETPAPTRTPTPSPSSSGFDCGTLSILIGNTDPSSGDPCYTEDVVVTIGLSPIGTEPVQGPMTLVGISANTSSDPVVLVSGLDYILGNNSNNNIITLTIPWETYQNQDYLSYHFCVRTAFGCEICADHTLNICPCPKYHTFCDCRIGATYGDIIKYTKPTVNYLGYDVPTYIDSVCDLLPLADVSVNSEGITEYFVTADALLHAFLAHYSWQNDPNSDTSATFLDIDGNGTVTSSEMFPILSMYGTSEGILLNDYTECFEEFLSCNYFEFNNINYVVGDYYYVEVPGGYSSCYRYDGLYHDCEDRVEHYISNAVINTTPYDDCPDCVNTHFPTPTPTQTPTMTPTPSKTNCEINLATLGDKVVGGVTVNVNVVYNYLQPRHDVQQSSEYSPQTDGFDEVIPSYGDVNGEVSWSSTSTLPSLCTFYHSNSLWATTINGLNQQYWESIQVNRITGRIFVSCDSDCRTNERYLTDSNSVPLSWGVFRDNFLEYTEAMGSNYAATLPLTVYDEVNDIVYRIATQEIHEQVRNGVTITSYVPTSYDDLLLVEEISNCQSNNDILVTDDGAGWSFNGQTGNPTLSFEKGKTYRFHVLSDTKDFWIGMSDEQTILVDSNNDPCADPNWVETINPESLLSNCVDGYDTSLWCHATNSASGSSCAQILHEKVYTYGGVFDNNYNKTVIFRPDCDFSCDKQLFYYDRLVQNPTPQDCNNHVGLILIKEETDCATGIIVTHEGYMSQTTGLIPNMIVQWEDCEGNTYTYTIVHPGPSTPMSGIQPFDYEIPGCVKKSTVKVLPNFITVNPSTDDSGGVAPDTGNPEPIRPVKSARCWCGSRINESQDCWTACGMTKPNFSKFDKRTPIYTEKNGVKVMSDKTLHGWSSNDAPFTILGSVTNWGYCCDNCDVDGFNIVNYKYHLAVNCCDPNDVIIVRVFQDVTKGDGFNLISKDPNDVDINGNPNMTCYRFTNEILVGCTRGFEDITVLSSDIITRSCETAVSDYDVALANDLCLECPPDAVESPCTVPYGQIDGISGNYHEMTFDFGSQTGTINMVFNALESSNRIQVYQVMSVSGQEILKADSLWVGELISGYAATPGTPEFDNYATEIASLQNPTNTSGLQVFKLNADCTDSWDYINLDGVPLSSLWLSTGNQISIPNGVQTSDIPIGFNGNIITRGQGFEGQVGVVSNYPSSDSLASDPVVKLSFNKNSSVHNIYKVKVWAHNDNSISQDGWTLDVNCIDPCSTEVTHLWNSNDPCLFPDLINGNDCNCVVINQEYVNALGVWKLSFEYTDCETNEVVTYNNENPTADANGLGTRRVCVKEGTLNITYGTVNTNVDTDCLTNMSNTNENNGGVWWLRCLPCLSGAELLSNWSIPQGDNDSVLMFNSTINDPLNVYTEAVQVTNGSVSYFQAPHNGLYSFRSKMILGLSNASFNGVWVFPYLEDLDTGAFIERTYKGVDDQGHYLVFSPNAHPWTTDWNNIFGIKHQYWFVFENVYLQAGQRITLKLSKTPGPIVDGQYQESNTGWGEMNQSFWQDHDDFIYDGSEQNWGNDPNQTLYVYSKFFDTTQELNTFLSDNGTSNNFDITGQELYETNSYFKLLDFQFILNPTQLFIDSDTPNLPQPCDYAYLDPCCSLPAEGHMIVTAPNGQVFSYEIDENGLISDCDCCPEEPGLQYVSDPQTCENIGEILVFVPNAFTADGDGINDVWEPVFNEPNCVTWTMRLFPGNCAAIDGWSGQIHEFSNGESWDGTFDQFNNGNISGPYSCVYTWTLEWESVDGQSGFEEGFVTCIV